MSVMHAPARRPAPAASSGARLVADDGRALSFQGGTLHVHAAGGLARVRLTQRFVNPHAEPLAVTLQVPLPADAAVSGFAFTVCGERVVGEVDRRRRARERYEEALVAGHTAALLEEDRSSLFRQRAGNVPPGEEMVCELSLDLMLAWEQGGWCLRFPTVVAPRYQGALGRVVDAARQLVGVAPQGTPARMGLVVELGDTLTGPVRSPSHRIVVAGTAVGLADEAGATLDRDLVLRWPVAAPAGEQLALDVARPTAENALSEDAFGLLSLVPPAAAGPALPRDLVVLLDTSGSMRGAPLAQAQAVTRALIASLGPEDQLQIIEFSVRPRAWRSAPVQATVGQKRAADAWVAGLRAGGGTEMRSGILAALETLRDEAQRQVVLVTDGLIGFEKEIVSAVATGLPRGCRVHTVGIGSAVNRSLLAPVARAGGGRELVIGLEESPDVAAAALVAATAAPQVVDVELSGSALRAVACHRVPDLMAGRPVRVALCLDPAGGTLELRGHTAAGPWSRSLSVPPRAPGEGRGALVALYGREAVEELELQAAQSGGAPVDAAIEALGLAHQISTRLTSWVAVSAQQRVDPTAPSRHELVPQALPAGMSMAGLGLRAAQPPGAFAGAAPAVEAAGRPLRTARSLRSHLVVPPPRPSAAPKKRGPSRRRGRGGPVPPPVQEAPAPLGMSDGPVPPPPAGLPLPSAPPAGRGGGAPPEAPSAPPAPSLADDASFADDAPSADRETFADAEVFADEDLDGVVAAGHEDEQEEEELDAAAPALRALEGTVVLDTETTFVVNVFVDGAGLDWTVPRTVVLVTAQGERVATVVVARTTRTGRLGAGTSLRLVLGPVPRGLRVHHIRVGALRVELPAGRPGAGGRG